MALAGGFRVGSWHVEPGLNAVSRNGSSVRLEPKVIQVLICLAERAGEPVTKEELFQTVWPNTFVSDDVLRHSIFELRQVFEDDPRKPHFIQTIPKRGYRLVARVEQASGNGAATASVTPVRLAGKLLIVAAVLVLVVVLNSSGLLNRPERKNTAETSLAHVQSSVQDIRPDVLKKRPTRVVPAHRELNEAAPIMSTVENGRGLATNGDAGKAGVPVLTGPVPVETRVQNIFPDMVRTRVTRVVLPSYPEFAKQSHVAGTVEIGLGISPRGDVASARVLIGHPILVTPALEAIRQWQFQPNLVQGELTWSRMRALVRFNADGTTAVAFAPPLLADSFGDPGSRRDELREAATAPIVREGH